jgi:hypothetical protein
VHRSPSLRLATFGAADGVTTALGLLVALAGQPHAIVRAATGAGLAGMVGMTAGEWLSDSAAGFPVALACGCATLAACLLPAAPYAVTAGTAARAVSLLLVVAVAGVVAWLRPEKGVVAVAQTYGVLAAAAALCFTAGLI